MAGEGREQNDDLKFQLSDKQTITAPTIKPDESQCVVVRWTKRRGNQGMRVTVDAASVNPVNTVNRGRSFSVGAASEKKLIRFVAMSGGPTQCRAAAFMKTRHDVVKGSDQGAEMDAAFSASCSASRTASNVQRSTWRSPTRTFGLWPHFSMQKVALISTRSANPLVST